MRTTRFEGLHAVFTGTARAIEPLTSALQTRGGGYFDSDVVADFDVFDAFADGNGDTGAFVTADEIGFSVQGPVTCGQISPGKWYLSMHGGPCDRLRCT